MKFAIYILSIAFVIVSCNNNKNPGIPDNALNPDLIKNPATASSSKEKTKLPEIQFEEETYDFGTIKEGEKISHDFKFRNTGNAELIIRSGSGSCGCTVPEWPKDPVPPGGSGAIKVTFNSEGKSGMQHKNVTIVSNTIPNTRIININGEVVSAEKK